MKEPGNEADGKSADVEAAYLLTIEFDANGKSRVIKTEELTNKKPFDFLTSLQRTKSQRRPVMLSHLIRIVFARRA